MLRTIMIFPEFKNMDLITEIRKKYDPLAKLVAPHITLVFPFESELSNKEIEKILCDRLTGIEAFEITLNGISAQSDKFGNYLFLNVVNGQEQLLQINKILYQNEFKEYDIGLSYIPHMTIGNLPDSKAMEEAYESLKEFNVSFHTTINKVSVEMIGENEESVIIIEKDLKEWRSLFEIDTKDYDINGSIFSRPSARGIIIKDGKLAMVHSVKYDYYKFPGGGIHAGENKKKTLVREVLEETGLTVIPNTIKEYGMVHRIQKGDQEDVFIQDNYYYLCSTKEDIQKQNLDDYEEDEQFTLEYVSPRQVIEANMACTHPDADKIMLERECKVIQMLVDEQKGCL